MEFKVEKNIPIPLKYTTGITGTMRKLKVGDSFICQSQSGAFYPAAKKLKIKITVRNEGNGNFRIWRVK